MLSAIDISVGPSAPRFDFHLHAGEIVGATGLDGQGHGDFLRVVAGLSPPFSGSITVAGRNSPEPVRDLSEATAKGIAYISGDRAHDGIFPNLSIFENFALPLYRSTFGEFGWIDPRPLEQAFVDEIRRLSIKVARASNLISSLSGGNQQKVLIGRALAVAPRMIILDDPARGVDVGTKRELHAQLKDFAGRGGAVIYLSSEIEEFFDFADCVLVFRNKTVFKTFPSANFSEHALLAAMFGDWRDRPNPPKWKVPNNLEDRFPSGIPTQSAFDRADCPSRASPARSNATGAIDFLQLTVSGAPSLL